MIVLPFLVVYGCRLLLTMLIDAFNQFSYLYTTPVIS
ncbi:MAG: hypothetical protein JWR38_2913 [Mucilaginibacter sp.]|nr:hypothetical protein [Mucilaginibacter sp.]